MAFQVADRVKETSTTTGTGTLDLGGAPDTYETFVAGIGNGNTTYYAIANRAANEWEVGIGTVTDAATDTLSRDTVISSSNSDNLVNFSAGTKDVICTLPSEKSFVIDNSSNTTITSNLAVTGGATFTANVSLGDNDVLNFGAGSDLQIYHDPAASHSYISEGGTGDLIIEGGNIRLENGSSEYYIRAFNNAQVELYYDNSKKLETTTTGVQTTGTVSVNGAYTLPTADGSANQVLQTDGSGAVSFATISADITGVTAGNGLTGGGTSGDVTLNVGAGALLDVTADAVDVDLSELTDMTEAMVGTDEFVVLDASSQKRKAAQEINLSIFNNDLPGDIEGVTAGNGLTGGGTSGTVTLNVGAGNLIDVTADAIDVDLSELATSTSNGDGDFFCVVDSANAQKKLTKGNIDISGFNNDAGYTTNVGDITGVTAGNGLTGGGASGAVSLAVGAGTGIDVTADAVAVDVSDFMTNGSNNRVLTATGADGMNAEANMTFDGSTLAVTGGATFTANVSLSDDDYLRFGNSQDLLIYHDGSHSRINEQGTGDLLIMSNGANVKINKAATETTAVFTTDGAVELYYNNSKKFETTSTGISVTGTVVESSSIAYKENVQPLDFNDAIYNVNAVKYDRKDGSSKDEVGVIAEELYKVLPDLVECKDGKPEAVKYTKMTMYLLEALKKQNQEIQELKAKLN